MSLPLSSPGGFGPNFSMSIKSPRRAQGGTARAVLRTGERLSFSVNKRTPERSATFSSKRRAAAGSGSSAVEREDVFPDDGMGLSSVDVDQEWEIMTEMMDNTPLSPLLGVKAEPPEKGAGEGAS